MQAHRLSGLSTGAGEHCLSYMAGLPNDLCCPWPRQCTCYLTSMEVTWRLLSSDMRQGYLLLTSCCLPAGVYTGTGNNGLSFAACPSAVIMQSLAGEVNTIIDLAGGSRAFTFTTEPAGTTISGTSLPGRTPSIMLRLSVYLGSEQTTSALWRCVTNDKLNEAWCELMRQVLYHKTSNSPN